MFFNQKEKDESPVFDEPFPIKSCNLSEEGIYQFFEKNGQERILIIIKGILEQYCCGIWKWFRLWNPNYSDLDFKLFRWFRRLRPIIIWPKKRREILFITHSFEKIPQYIFMYNYLNYSQKWEIIENLYKIAKNPELFDFFTIELRDNIIHLFDCYRN